MKHWKSSVERLLTGGDIDFVEATRLVSEIAAHAADAVLRQAATQAIPILRNVARGTDHGVAPAARRRLFMLFDVLQKLTAPRFGTRHAKPKPLTAEERARKMLQLPLGTNLGVPEIRQAFRRAAKMVHPDVGGSEEAFRELIAAQEMLIQPRLAKGQ